MWSGPEGHGTSAPLSCALRVLGLGVQQLCLIPSIQFTVKWGQWQLSQGGGK